VVIAADKKQFRIFKIGDTKLREHVDVGKLADTKAIVPDVVTTLGGNSI
jgi:hypothetical protein